MVTIFFEDGLLEPELNETLITLIPKVPAPEFRPISLCIVLNKIITKVLANCLKKWLLSLVLPNQASFVAGRQITDNVIIAQEVIHTMRGKCGREGWMAIKVDLEKAYDRRWWDFIEETLYDVGLPLKFVQAVMLCVSTCSMRVVWNGHRSEQFNPSRGIQQGDPLSPYLFVLCMKRLSQVIHQKVATNLWRPIRMGRGRLQISRLFFADDLVLFSSTAASSNSHPEYPQ